MSVALFHGRVRLEGECRVEDAETLLTLLQSDPGRVVDVTGVRHVHAAVLQVLMALRPRIEGIPEDDVTARWILTRDFTAMSAET